MNYYMSTKINKSPYLFLVDIFEYVLLLAIILECNSLFGNSVENGSYYVNKYLTRIANFTVFLLCLPYLFKIKNLFNKISLSIIFFILACGSVFYFLNVKYIDDSYAKNEYIKHFLIFLPLICFYFKIKCFQFSQYELFFKYSNIICVFSFFSLCLYLTYTFHSEITIHNLLRTRWSGVGEIRELYNFFNFSTIEAYDTRNIFGIIINRNYGWYPESPMFCIALVSALYTELFLRKNKISYFRCCLLLLTIFSSQATLGMMLGVLGICMRSLTYVKTYQKNTTWIITLIIAVATILLFVLYRQKLSYTSSSSLSSHAVHINDYKVALLTFLQNPFLGCGYNAEQYIQQFMSPERLISNRGLSNSVSVILAEGGLFLGTFCMLPYFVCLFQLFKNNYRYFGFWAMGIFGLYCLMIFHFHLYFMMLIAFGYSLINIKFSKKNRYIKCSVILGKQEEYISTYNHLSKKITYLAYSLPVICLILFFTSETLWNFIDNFYLKNQLFLSNSVWKPFFLIIVGIYIVLLFKNYITSINDKIVNTSLFRVINFIFWSYCYYLCYPLIYSHIITYLEIKGIETDIKITALSFTSYVIFIGITEYIFYLCIGIKKSFFKYCLAVSVYILTIVGIYFGFINTYYNKPIFSNVDLIKRVSEVSQGKLYSDVIPIIFKNSFSNLKLSSSKGKNYAKEKNISVIVPHNQDIRELYANHFISTEISKYFLLYTNDPPVVKFLLSNGYKTSNFYSYESNIDLKQMGIFNNLPISSNNSLIIKGKSNSLIHGPYDHLEKGKYKVDFVLHNDKNDAKSNNKIATIRISSYSGRNILNKKELFTSDFNADGNLKQGIEFDINNQTDGLEYLVIAEDGISLEISSISITQIQAK